MFISDFYVETASWPPTVSHFSFLYFLVQALERLFKYLFSWHQQDLSFIPPSADMIKRVPVHRSTMYLTAYVQSTHAGALHGRSHHWA